MAYNEHRVEKIAPGLMLFLGVILPTTSLTYQQIKDELDAEFVKAVAVKGKTGPVRVYKILGRKAAPDGKRVHTLEI
jgi:hypothetical protein